MIPPAHPPINPHRKINIKKYYISSFNFVNVNKLLRIYFWYKTRKYTYFCNVLLGKIKKSVKESGAI